MTGGGFGGCTVTMLRPDAVARFGEEMARAYQRQFQATPQSLRLPALGRRRRSEGQRRILRRFRRHPTT